MKNINILNTLIIIVLVTLYLHVINICYQTKAEDSVFYLIIIGIYEIATYTIIVRVKNAIKRELQRYQDNNE